MVRNLVIVLLVTVFAGAAYAGDLVRLKVDPGEEARWIITTPESLPPTAQDFENSQIVVLEENYDNLVYGLKIGGRTQRQEEDMADVAQVYYYPQPPAWSSAVQALEGNDLDTAVQRFTELATNRQVRDWVRVYSLYNLAQAYEALDQPQDAINAWERLKKDFPKSRFVVDGLVRIALLKDALGDRAGARSALNELQRLPGLPESRKALGRYYLIVLVQRQGEQSNNRSLISQAESQYRQLLSQVQSDPELDEVETLCRLGIGTCMVLQDRFEEALTYFEQIATATNDPEVLARAYNGIGQCHLRQGNYKQAVKAFLRVEILYDVLPMETAKALFFSGQAFQFLMQGGKVDDAKERAKAQYRKCMGRFGGTKWGRDASERLLTVR